MKRLISFGVLAATLAAGATVGGLAVAGERLVLAKGGATDYVLVRPSRPTPVETRAAKELQEHLGKVAGATFSIVPEDLLPDDDATDGEPSRAKAAGNGRFAGKKRIFVGPGKWTKRLLPDVDPAKLGRDAIVIKTVGDDLVLLGQGRRGTLYAVHTFLEDTVGCRWWTSTESFTPKRPTLEIPRLDVTHTPKLRIREAFYRDAFDGIFAARCKCNGHFARIPEEYGGHERFAAFVHTFYQLLPPDKYFAQHPEWYSQIKGKRTHERAQLCLTNEAMRRELTRVAIERLRAEPGAGVISISQNDWAGRCQCAKCRAVEEEEGSPSGLLLRFVNAVAEDIEKEFPDVLVETLAYQYTRQPPKHVRPRKNVVIRLCSIACSFSQPIATGPQNEAFRRDMDAWSEIAPRLYIWDYVTNFSNYMVPHPNLRVLGPNIRYFIDHGAVALFEQGDAGCSVGDFVRLRAWLLAHLMWDPSRDEEALIREFLEGYYGPAAPHLEAYLKEINDAGQRSGVYLRCFMTDTSKYLTLDDLNRATAHYRKAEAAVAGDPVLARRVRRERLPLDHVWLSRYDALRAQAKSEKKEFLGPADPKKACQEFLQSAHEFRAEQWRERRPFSERESELRQRFLVPTSPAAR